MSMSDPIADMLTRIRNAQLAKKNKVTMPMSKIKSAIADVLKDEGYIDDYSMNEKNGLKSLNIKLKYFAGSPVIERIERVSKPGLRIYKPSSKVPDVLDGLGVAIISTSQGVMTGKKAKESGIGGEVLCLVV